MSFPGNPAIADPETRPAGSAGVEAADAAFWAPFLAPGERLLWTGRPPVTGRETFSAVLRRWSIAALVLAGLLALGALATALFWVVNDWARSGDYGTLAYSFEIAAGIAATLLAIAAASTILGAIDTRRTRARTRQAVTDRQVLVARLGRRAEVESLAFPGPRVTVSEKGLVTVIRVGPEPGGLTLESATGEAAAVQVAIAAASTTAAAGRSAGKCTVWSGRPVPGVKWTDLDGDFVGGVLVMVFGTAVTCFPLLPYLTDGFLGADGQPLSGWSLRGLVAFMLLFSAAGIGAAGIGFYQAFVLPLRRIRQRRHISFHLRGGGAAIAVPGQPDQHFDIFPDTKLIFHRGRLGTLHFAEKFGESDGTITRTPVGFDHLAPADADAAWQTLLALRAVPVLPAARRPEPGA